jgi:tungstate transport system substrate-binding protein
MKRAALVLAVAAALLLASLPGGCGGSTGSAGRSDVVLATTTSTEDSGILKEFVKRFEAENPSYKIKPVAVGSGAALFMGSNGDADIMLTHEPVAEKQFADKGDAQSSFKLMHNDFVIVGPASDPARIKGMTDGAAAMKRIADSGSRFVSRGDASGTNAMEMTLWQRAGVDTAGKPWYIQSGQGMGETLRIADEKGAYTLTDKATYTVMSPYLKLKKFVDGDPTMKNQYTVTVVSPEKFPGVNNKGAKAFAAFLVEPSTRKLISTFGLDHYEQRLFYPD